jgi:hypothetical protein
MTTHTTTLWLFPASAGAFAPRATSGAWGDGGAPDGPRLAAPARSPMGLSVPKRLRYFVQRDGAVFNLVLRVVLRIIAQSPHQHCPLRRAGFKAAH